jgi:hypothetical protein
MVGVVTSGLPMLAVSDGAGREDAGFFKSASGRFLVGALRLPLIRFKIRDCIADVRRRVFIR